MLFRSPRARITLEGMIYRDMRFYRGGKIVIAPVTKKMLSMSGVSDNDLVQILDIVKVDAENNLIAIRGAVPGPKNGIVYITDSVKA